MLLQTRRFAFGVFLLAAVGLVLTACDDGGGGPSLGTFNDGTTDTLDIASMSPDEGADVDSRTPTLTVKFTQQIAANEYTNATTPQQDSETGDAGRSGRSDNRRLIDGIRLTPETAKSVTPSGSIPVDIAWTNGRASLAITVDASDEDFQGLEDGYIYTLSLGDRGSDTGVYDKRFKSTSGSLFRDLNGDGDVTASEEDDSNPTLDPGDLQFSVGLDTDAPSAPPLSFEDQAYSFAGGGPTAGEDNATIADAGELDYTDDTVVAELSITNAGTVENVKGYEVYYRSQNQVGRTGRNDQFVKATDGQLSETTDAFEDSEGIIPISAVDNSADNFDDGELEFAVELTGSPLEADDQSYGPIEWKVRAVSINGVRGPFKDPAIVSGDNTQPDVESGTADEVNNEVTVEFSEPVTADAAGDYDVTIDGNSVTVNSVDLDNSGSTPTATLQTEDFSDAGGGTDEVQMTSGTDLAGNDFDIDNATGI